MKNKKIVLTEYRGFDACFEYEDDKLSGLILETEDDINVNDIFIGRVLLVKNEIKACFVEILPSVVGFLPFSAVRSEGILNRSFDGRILQGDEILVSVDADRIKTKEYTLTMDITIPGIYSVCTLYDNNVRISAKLSKIKAEELKETYSDKSYPYGYILRTNSYGAPYEKVISELDINMEILDNIYKTCKTRTLFSNLFRAPSPFFNRVTTIRGIDEADIITDSLRLMETFPQLNNIRFYDDNFPLKTLFSFDRAFDEVTNRKVDLKSGGYLIIEPTEALTVIDVNSGKFDKKVSKEEAVRIINTEACIEACRQLRLRNLSGIIIIDFINTLDDRTLTELELLIKQELKKDPIKVKFVDFTQLSLCEITREKKYPSVYERLKKKG